MARPRPELQAILEQISGVQKVYFQPPDGKMLQYPCIVYSRDSRDTSYADNRPHFIETRYTITVMDQDPDSLIPDQVAQLPYSSFSQAFTVDDLYHDVYTLYF